MRALRLTPLALLVALLGSVLVGGTSASVASPAATPHNLQAPTKSQCEAAQASVLGKACVDRRGMILANEWVTVQDGRAQWIHPNQWDLSFSWTVPQSIPAKGAQMRLALSATELTRGPNARICPAMGVRGGFALKQGGVLQGQPVQVDVCAQAGATAPASKTVTLVPGTATPGTLAFLTVGIQDGPVFTYRYRAVAAPTTCRKLSSAGSDSVDCPTSVRFVFSHGGLPKPHKFKQYLDMTTNGGGSAKLDPDGGDYRVTDAKVRVVRTVEYLTTTGERVTPVEARLVFRAREGAPGVYRPGKGGGAISIPLQLVSSNDPDCGKRDVDEAAVALREGGPADALKLSVDGCPEHSLLFTDRSAKKQKPLVAVAISDK